MFCNLASANLSRTNVKSISSIRKVALTSHLVLEVLSFLLALGSLFVRASSILILLYANLACTSEGAYSNLIFCLLNAQVILEHLREKNVGQLMRGTSNASDHAHSEAAFGMLKDYHIGSLNDMPW